MLSNFLHTFYPEMVSDVYWSRHPSEVCRSSRPQGIFYFNFK